MHVSDPLRRHATRYFVGTLWATTIALTCVLLVLIYKSRTWGIVWDAAFWHYGAWLITEGFVPYRDFFDICFPGTYLIHLFVITCIGDADIHWRIFDLLCLAAIALLILIYLRPFGWLAGWIAAVIFAGFHIYNGPLYLGQRDYILLVFVLGAFCCLARHMERQGGGIVPVAVAGLLLGFAVSIKPYCGLLCLFLFIIIIVHALWKGNGWLKYSLVFGLSITVVPALLIVWLWLSGGLPFFLDILFEYLLVFYSKFVFNTLTNGDIVLFLGMHSIEIMVIAAIAVMVGLIVRENRMRRLFLIVGIIYGFFHFYFQVRNLYQLYPFALFMFMSIASWAGCIRARVPNVLKYITVALLIHVCLIAMYRSTKMTVTTPPHHIAVFSCKEQLVADLAGRLSENGTVQVMDFSTGHLHALYTLRYKQPTRFLYDLQFFHNIDTPYIQNLRREFMEALRRSPPEFLVFSIMSWPLEGYERLKVFPELAEWLSEYCELESENSCYRLYRYRKP